MTRSVVGVMAFLIFGAQSLALTPQGEMVDECKVLEERVKWAYALASEPRALMEFLATPGVAEEDLVRWTEEIERAFECPPREGMLFTHEVVGHAMVDGLLGFHAAAKDTLRHRQGLCAAEAGELLTVLQVNDYAAVGRTADAVYRCLGAALVGPEDAYVANLMFELIFVAALPDEYLVDLLLRVSLLLKYPDGATTPDRLTLEVIQWALTNPEKLPLRFESMDDLVRSNAGFSVFDSGDALYAIGMGALMQGRHETALAAFREAMRIGLPLVSGSAALQLGSLSVADRTLETVVDMCGTRADVQSLCGRDPLCELRLRDACTLAILQQDVGCQTPEEWKRFAGVVRWVISVLPGGGEREALEVGFLLSTLVHPCVRRLYQAHTLVAGVHTRLVVGNALESRLCDVSDLACSLMSTYNNGLSNVIPRAVGTGNADLFSAFANLLARIGSDCSLAEGTRLMSDEVERMSTTGVMHVRSFAPFLWRRAMWGLSRAVGRFLEFGQRFSLEGLPLEFVKLRDLDAPEVTKAAASATHQAPSTLLPLLACCGTGSGVYEFWESEHQVQDTLARFTPAGLDMVFASRAGVGEVVSHLLFVTAAHLDYSLKENWLLDSQALPLRKRLRNTGVCRHYVALFIWLFGEVKKRNPRLANVYAFPVTASRYFGAGHAWVGLLAVGKRELRMAFADPTRLDAGHTAEALNPEYFAAMDWPSNVVLHNKMELWSMFWGCSFGAQLVGALAALTSKLPSAWLSEGLYQLAATGCAVPWRRNEVGPDWRLGVGTH